MAETIIFEVGGRYRNRIGWYEVLAIRDDEMTVRYENDGTQKKLDFESQRRIIANIEFEEKLVIPFAEEGKNIKYFFTLGYICKKGFIEAIIPPKSKSGFDNTYRRVKGKYPSDAIEGYYIHHDENVDKWGVEMRLTLEISGEIDVDDLEFGNNIRVVNSPNDREIRINNNAFCWQLLQIGFDLGRGQDKLVILDNIPDKFRETFMAGFKIY